MRWVVVLLILVNVALVIGVSQWSSPGKLDVEGGSGTLPRVSALKVDRPAQPSGRVSEAEVVPDEPARPDHPPESAVAENVEPAHQQPAGKAEPLSDAVAEPAEESAAICGRIEGFESEEQTQGFIASHESLLSRTAIVEQTNPRPPYHWVIIPPLESRSVALKRLAEFQRAGVDSYLVTKGEYSNAISLGLFESERLAQELNARFQSRNVETVLVNKDRNQISYALVFAVVAQADLDRVVHAAERYAGDLKSVENASCEGVASPDKNP
ncbi:hypothetical protein J057_13872 [Marinobacter nanhaiticus D15-8W]|uniref:SPOR domain-containing protein n=1 Tax=Marinobacter nanhaiticus D15-8W TaxID=626887 RepID=N6VWA6_9GAMM|nr:hypothetical protein J057_13872 [Marinobacter nanhaiticus D15-8W]